MAEGLAKKPGSGVLRGQEIRRIILQQSKRANVGHIASNLSVADLIVALFGEMRIAAVHDPDRDRFILSKGHAALALYAALHLQGHLSKAQLNTFCGDGSLLGVHPERELPGIDFSTGSLGQGLSIGAGAALAARLQKSSRRCFVLASDAECNEGSVWEAAAFAAHHQLSNLVAIVDANGQQALGFTRDVLDMSPLVRRWAAFGWRTYDVDGHDAKALSATLAALETTTGPPHVLVAQTVAGHGVSFMERQVRWHYMPMSDGEYTRAMAEVEAAP